MPKKNCPDCNAEHGPRKLKCECGHDFFTNKPADDYAPVEIKRNNSGRVICSIYTPAGACPIKLNDLSYEGVQRWGGAVVASGIKIGVEYTPAAVRYWLREFVEIHSPLYEELKPACEELIA
jgi:hypothetical protein